MKASIVGLGKAGLPLAGVMASAGIEVIGIDIDQKRCDIINKGENPIPEEPDLAEIIEEHAGKNLVCSSDYKDAADATAYVIIVPLFIDNEKKPDYSILDKAFDEVSKIISDGDLVVLETTVPPGTTEKRFKKILDDSGKDYKLAYSPERIMTGYSVSRYREFPKVVGGVDKKSTEAAKDLYSRFCNTVIEVSDATTAEMVKVSEGIYRDVNIALANELFKVSEKIGVDYYEMREAASHEFCNLLLPGNVGGHCIPVYPWFLINEHEVPLIKQARHTNDDMIEYYAKKVPIDSKKVLIIGMTFRQGVKELAYTRSIPLAMLLRSKGYDVSCFDEMVEKEELEKLGLPYSADFSEHDSILLIHGSDTILSELRKIKERVIDVTGKL